MKKKKQWVLGGEYEDGNISDASKIRDDWLLKSVDLR